MLATTSKILDMPLPPATMVRYPLRKHPEVGVEESLASFAPATMGWGDSANKIGTYSLAVLSRHHGVPFYVAAPLTTLDAALLSWVMLGGLGLDLVGNLQQSSQLCSTQLSSNSKRWF